MSGHHMRRGAMTYVSWVLVTVFTIQIFFFAFAKPSEKVKSFIFSGSYSSSSSSSPSASLSPTVKQRLQTNQKPSSLVQAIPPWIDQILVPDSESSLERVNDGTCRIGDYEWEECGVNDRFCATYGYDAIGASQIYKGRTRRLRRVLRKAAQGKPITMGIMGGSVSTGQALNEKLHRNYKYQIAEWWEYAFPHSNLTFVDGAVRAQGSSFFSICYGAYIPVDVDIVFIESAINDEYLEKYAVYMENMMRGLMSLPNQPAIVLLQTFGLAFGKIATGGAFHIDVAAYYDHPVLSARQIILPRILDDPTVARDYFGTAESGDIDFRHINVGGHTVLADITIQLLSSELCKVQYEQFLYGVQPEPPLLDPPMDIPKQRLMDPYDPDKMAPVYAPTCNSTTSKLRPIIPSKSTAWTTDVINGKTFLAGHHPGEKVTFKINLMTKGTIQISYFRSSTYNLGIAKCYIESFGPESAITLDGYWDQNISIGDLATIRENVPAGEHEIVCSVQENTNSPLGGKKVLIVSIQSF